MALNRRRANVAYGLTNSLQSLAPEPIVAQRAPTTSDIAIPGSVWVDQVGNDSYVLIKVVANSATWVTTGGGAATVDSLIVTTTATIGTGLTVTSGSTSITSTANAADAIYLHANGGTSETIRLHADQGTGAASIGLVSDVGGVTLQSGLASDDAINLNATAGGIDIDATLQINIQGDEAAADAISLFTSDSAGGIQLTSSGDIAESIYLHADAGTSETIKIHADQGTALSSIDIVSDAGGARVTTAALAATTGLHLVQGAATAAIQVGAGAPSHAAPQGTLYLRTDGSSTSTRLYSNTDGATTWTNFTSAA